MTNEPTLEIPEPIRRLDRLNLRLIVSLCAALAVAVAAVVIALSYKHSNDALRSSQKTSQQAKLTSEQASAVASCVNKLLGARGPLTTADSNAEIDLFTRIFAVLFAKPADQPALYEQLLKHARPDIATLQTDKAKRDASPLGLC